MDKNTTLDNLGTPRIPQWPINIKELIHQHSRTVNFW